MSHERRKRNVLHPRGSEREGLPERAMSEQDFEEWAGSTRGCKSSILKDTPYMEEKHTKGVCLQMTRKIELAQVEVFGEELSSRREGWSSPGQGGFWDRDILLALCILPKPTKKALLLWKMYRGVVYCDYTQGFVV